MEVDGAPHHSFLNPDFIGEHFHDRVIGLSFKTDMDMFSTATLIYAIIASEGI